MTFAGFPARAQATAIPDAFFSDVLPQLATDAVDLGVTLYAFHALLRKKGFPRYLTQADLAAEPALAAFLDNAGAPADAIAKGLRRASEIGAFIELTVHSEGAARALYFLNAPADRRAMESLRHEAAIAGPPVAPVAHPAARTNIFKLYEAVIGTAPSNLIEELTEAERLYPAPWIEAAFHEASAQNARSWRYVSRILERWSNEGPDYAKAERDTSGAERYLSGKYGRIIKQRLEG